MAISRLRFALLALAFLSTAVAPSALAHKDLEQILPDSDGDGPISSATGGSHPEERGFRQKRNLTESKAWFFEHPLTLSQLLRLMWPSSRAIDHFSEQQ
jgi:hypothetical protein